MRLDLNEFEVPRGLIEVDERFNILVYDGKPIASYAIGAKLLNLFDIRFMSSCSRELRPDLETILAGRSKAAVVVCDLVIQGRSIAHRIRLAALPSAQNPGRAERVLLQIVKSSA